MKIASINLDLGTYDHELLLLAMSDVFELLVLDAAVGFMVG